MVLSDRRSDSIFSDGICYRSTRVLQASIVLSLLSSLLYLSYHPSPLVSWFLTFTLLLLRIQTSCLPSFPSDSLILCASLFSVGHVCFNGYFFSTLAVVIIHAACNNSYEENVTSTWAWEWRGMRIWVPQGPVSGSAPSSAYSELIIVNLLPPICRRYSVIYFIQAVYGFRLFPPLNGMKLSTIKWKIKLKSSSLLQTSLFLKSEIFLVNSQDPTNILLGILVFSFLIYSWVSGSPLVFSSQE